MQVLPRMESGGAERGTVEIAAAITRAGGRAVVVSQGGALVHQLARAGATHVELPVASKNPLTILRNVRRLEDVARAHRIQLIHARSRAPGWSSLWAARNLGLPFVTTYHAAYSGGGWKHRYNEVMARGDRVIAISRFIEEHVRHTYPEAGKKLRLIPRGVDIGLFHPSRVGPARLIQLARAWDLPEDRPLILVPGRLSRAKGLEVVLEALKGLSGRDWTALFPGAGAEGRYRAELEQKITAMGLGGRVRLLPNCLDMPAAYLLAHVVVAASTRPEGFGRVAVEAQAMGRPVIATDMGGFRETVLPGQTGWLVPPSDAPALTAAMARALEMGPELQSLVSTRAMAHVADNFRTETMCEKTLAVYAELVK